MALPAGHYAYFIIGRIEDRERVYSNRPAWRDGDQMVFGIAI